MDGVLPELPGLLGDQSLSLPLNRTLTCAKFPHLGTVLGNESDCWRRTSRYRKMAPQFVGRFEVDVSLVRPVVKSDLSPPVEDPPCSGSWMGLQLKPCRGSSTSAEGAVATNTPRLEGIWPREKVIDSLPPCFGQRPTPDFLLTPPRQAQ